MRKVAVVVLPWLLSLVLPTVLSACSPPPPRPGVVVVRRQPIMARRAVVHRPRGVVRRRPHRR